MCRIINKAPNKYVLYTYFVCLKINDDFDKILQVSEISIKFCTLFN